MRTTIEAERLYSSLVRADKAFDAFLKNEDDQALARGRGLPKELMPLRREARAAAIEFVGRLGSLSRKEKEAVAEALIKVLLASIKKLAKRPKAQKGYPEYNDSQARDSKGQWTVGGAAGAVGSFALDAIREALSKVTLIPSSRSNVNQAVDDWWKRLNSKDIEVHIDAFSEGATRLMFTLFFGVLAVVIADFYLSKLGVAVGSAVGQALRILIGGGR